VEKNCFLNYHAKATGSNEFMTHQLKSRDIIALGFMTFALFVGAGNMLRRSTPPPTFASATTVSTGKPTAVIRKPMAAVQTLGRCSRPRVPQPFHLKWGLLH
jgi:hypothetical protein